MIDINEMLNKFDKSKQDNLNKLKELNRQANPAAKYSTNKTNLDNQNLIAKTTRQYIMNVKGEAGIRETSYTSKPATGKSFKLF